MCRKFKSHISTMSMNLWYSIWLLCKILNLSWMEHTSISIIQQVCVILCMYAFVSIKCIHKLLFIQRGDLVKRQRIHNEEKPFQCDVCDKVPTSRQYVFNSNIEQVLVLRLLDPELHILNTDRRLDLKLEQCNNF